MSNSRGFLIFAGWLVPIAVLSAFSLSVAGLTVRGLLLMGIALTLTLPVALKATRRRLDLLEPLVLANFALAVMFIGRPLADLYTKQFYHLGYNVLPTFDQALVVALVGIAAFQLGYASPFNRIWARYLPRPARFAANRIVAVALIYAVLGALLFWFFLAKYGGLELILVLLQGRAASDNAVFIGSTGYLYNGILLWGATALLLFACAMVVHRKSYLILMLIFLVPLIIFYGARGTRSQLLPLVVAIPVFWYLWKNQRPRLVTILIAFTLGLSLLGWLREIRTAGQRGDVTAKFGEALMSPLDQAADMLTGPDADMFDTLANELYIVPRRLPFQHGATITDILIRAVPRPLWPNKPLESNDEVVSTLWPVHYSLSRASPASSLLGPLYADSGLVTVLLGMFLTGAASGSLWFWFCRHRRAATTQLIYSMALPFVVILMRGSIPDTLSRALFLVFPLVLVHVMTRIRVTGLPPRTANKNSG